MKKEIIKILIFTFGISLIVALLFSAQLFFSWDKGFSDKLFLASRPNQDIVIVAIDNESINELGRWPWDRSIHADLINKICQASPAVLGVDINFLEPSNSESDQQLASALADCPQVVLPVPADIDLTTHQVFANSLTFPISEFKDVVSLGVINSPLDKDGIFRRALIDVSDQEGKIYNSFASVISQKYLDQINLGDLPLDEQGRMLVNYVGPPGSFTKISVKNILNNQNQLDFNNKIVLIGATAPDLHDNHLTPTSNGIPMDGVEIHANAINTIVEQNFLTPLRNYQQIIIFVILILLASILLFRLNLIQGSLSVLALLFLYLVVALLTFDQGYILNLFYALVAILLTYLSIVVFRNLTDRKEKKKIRNAFSRYVSSEVIEEILADPEKLKLGGQNKKLSILFSDIRSFTSISEKLSAHELVAFLNDYLSVMSDLIMDGGGVVDKYIGDAVMAFWGAPISRGKHAKLSCRVAVAMISELERNSSRWEKEYGFAPAIGIGINTGDVIVGNIGSDKRFDYTVMGDAVNLASRLEGLTKKYGVKIIVSSFTKELAGDEFTFRFLDKVAVKGKKESVEIFELVELTKNIQKEKEKSIKQFEQAVSYYKNREWDKATQLFKELNREEDKAITLYLERCAQFKKNPPPSDWDGSHILTEK